ncbi:cysteine-rich venom protein latisemin-like [Antedon mediterranea]|uniref:cysteine-rich venom protein latisemin-like n=1 Tax=Antedon mediterranea TaxID=105859 RepID=UPI003AF5F67E
MREIYIFVIFVLGQSNGNIHSRVRRSTDFSTSEAQAILDKHNELRSQVSPEAADMKFMEWDDDLASMAQEWSDGCSFAHGQPDNISPFEPVGQNLWLGSYQPNGLEAAQAWYNEVSDYDYDTDGCEPGRVCGHYTQVVWADSYAVGCGLTFCESTPQGQSDVWLLTCNYGPAGNYNRQPYVSGPSCTECSSGSDECYENQCRPCSEHSEECVCNQECENCGTITSDCRCTCPNGYYGNGCTTICEDTHEYCYAGWYPAQCGIGLSYVERGCPLMCGVCVEEDADFVCNNACDSGPCLNGGTCTHDGSGYTCTCLDTYTGTTCQTQNPCGSAPCLNGGTCTNDGSGYTCTCLDTYTGTTCQSDKCFVIVLLCTMVFF